MNAPLEHTPAGNRCYDIPATVQSNIEIAPGFHRMKLMHESPQLHFEPGQFFQLQIQVGALSPLLRRPFAPSEVTPESVTFVYAVVGDGTHAMAALPFGHAVRILAPLGHGYTPPPAGTAAVLVGGGCGTPNLRHLAVELRDRGTPVYSIIGARSACTLLEVRPLCDLSKETLVATDDGSEGICGTSIDAFRALLDRIREPRYEVFACGPYPMLRALYDATAPLGVRCQVSLEERMACGFGACMGCAVKVCADTPEGYIYKRVCHDGPVFDAEDLVWD